MSDHVDPRAHAYRRAQLAIAELKSATYEVLLNAGAEGLTNAQVGRCLGIYQGHIGHEGHISRTVLQMLQHDGVIEQAGPRGRWLIKEEPAAEAEDGKA